MLLLIINKFHSANLFYIFKRDLLSLNHFYLMLMMNLNPKNKTGLGHVSKSLQEWAKPAPKNWFKFPQE